MCCTVTGATCRASDQKTGVKHLRNGRHLWHEFKLDVTECSLKHHNFGTQARRSVRVAEPKQQGCEGDVRAFQHAALELVNSDIAVRLV